MNEDFIGAGSQTRDLAVLWIAEARSAYERWLSAGAEAFNRWDDLSAQTIGDARRMAQITLTGSDAYIRAIFDLLVNLAQARSWIEAQDIQRAFLRDEEARQAAGMREIERLANRRPRV